MTEVNFRGQPMVCSICGESVGQTGVMTVELRAVTNEAGRKELVAQYFRQCRKCTSKPGSGVLVGEVGTGGAVGDVGDIAVQSISPSSKKHAFHGYLVVQPAFKPGRGLATVLFALVKQQPRMSQQQLTDALLASGEYHRVAPGAAKGNALKPVEVTLQDWVRKGVLVHNPVEAPAANENTSG